MPFRTLEIGQRNEGRTVGLMLCVLQRVDEEERLLRKKSAAPAAMMIRAAEGTTAATITAVLLLLLLPTSLVSASCRAHSAEQ